MMKKYCVLSILSLAMAPIWAIPLSQAPIEKVTIYQDGALIERKITVQAGQSLIELDKLPANFDMEQLQAETSNGIKISNMVVNDSQKEIVLNERSLALQKDVTAIEAQIENATIEKQAAQMQITYLTNMSATGGQSTPIRLQARQAFQTIKAADKQLADLEKKLTNAKRNLSSQSASRLFERSLNIHLQALQSGQITLRYVVKNASWQPFYRASLDSQNEKVNLERMALVRQQSGEDWRNVHIALSSDVARDASGQLNPKPWSLAYLMNNTQYERSRSVSRDYSSRIGFKGEEDLGHGLKSIWQTETVELPYAVSYQSPQAITILSSNEEVIVPLEKKQWPVTLSTRISPQLGTEAVVEASFPSLEGIWLPGTIKLFRDGAYIGQAFFDNTGIITPKLGFGEDKRIQVTVQNKDIQRQQSGSRQIFQQKQTYQIQNNHNKAVNIVLLEAVPISNHKDIKIKHQFSQEQSSTTWQNQEGIYQWQSQIPAKGQWQLSTDYEINYPKDKTITGLPR